MIEFEKASLPQLGSGRIILQPNPGMSWQATQWAWGALACVSLLIAIGFTIVGLWPILPFAGIELAVLAWAFWYTARQAQLKQVITLTQDEVKVESGRYYANQCWCYPRQLVQLEITQAKPHVGRTCIAFTTKHHRIELGSFLNRQESHMLSVTLKSWVNEFMRRDQENR